MKNKHCNYGKSNPSYKGNIAKYGAIHAWVRQRKHIPKKCERCNQEKN